MKRTSFLFAIVFALLGAIPVSAQLPGGQTAINVAADEAWTGQTFPAILKLPSDYSSTTKNYPIIIFLHGTGESGSRDGSELYKIYASGQAGGPSYFIAQGTFPEDVTNPITGVSEKFIVLSPQAPGWSVASNQLKFIINDMVSRYRIDLNRIYLTGISAGGQGVFDYVSHNGTEPLYKPAAITPMSAATAASQAAANIIVADGVKAWGFGSTQESHGVTTQNFMIYMNNAQAGSARFTDYLGGHCCWNNYYNPNYREVINGKSMNMYEWMLTQSRGGQTLSANAGSNITITLPNSAVSLNGSGTPPSGGSIVSYNWSKKSGGSATIATPSNAATTVTGLTQGVYVLTLTVTDNMGASSTSDVQVVVNGANNNPPTANAGLDISIQLPTNSTTLNGSASTDADGTITSYAWSKVSGPASGTIVNPTAVTTSLNNLSVGTYVFALTVTDDLGATASDNVQVTVKAANNIPPTANAGADQVIQLPTNSVVLNGSSSVDPDGTIVSYIWKKINGPASSTFGSPGVAITTVNNLVQGLYQFSLTVTDNLGVSVNDTVQIIVNSAPNGCNGVRRVLVHESWGGAFNGISFTYSPGDTLVVRAGDGWGSLGLSLENFHGTASCPIVVINEGGATPLGAILLRNSTHIKVTGSGSGEFYGFVSNGAFSAVDIDGRSANIEIERWKITNAGYICRAKQDGACADSLNYPNWYMDNISIHDTWSRNINQDGMYFGNTAPATGRPIVCNGVTISPIPMRLSNISIYNNFIDSCGRTGIQISGADKGVNNIYNNVVRRTGFELNQTQGSGIIIGGMAYANVYNNTVRQTFQFGIQSMGSGFSKIENNNLDSIGQIGPMSNPGYKLSIAVNAIYTYPLDSSMVWIKNNICDNSDVHNIITGNAAGTWVTTGNIICGNKMQNGSAASIYLNGPGFSYASNCSGTNQPPSANVGPNQTITLPVNQITLNGSASYDPEGGRIFSYSWSRVSGPNSPGITAQAAAVTTVTGLVQGIYVFQLTVTDSLGLAGSAQVTITVNAAQAINQPPTANAGADQTITLPVNSVLLSGLGNDPDGTVVSFQWTKISGPVQHLLTNPNNSQTTAGNLLAGTYGFLLVVTDNVGATGKDTVYVTVNPPVNQIPVANAGPNQTITLPINSVTLNGSGTDADGTIVSYFWNKISGPSQFTIATATQAQTSVSNLVQGVYGFALIVTDNNGATGRDSVFITVLPAINIPPGVSAGANSTIQLPVNFAPLNGTATDPDGTISSTLWTKLSGPSQFTILNPGQLQTTAANMVQGTYSFELQATDNNGANSRDTISITVLPGNQPPVANAGADVWLVLPTNTTILNGTGTDPDGTISTYQWSKVSGPSQFVVLLPANAQTPVNNLAQGVYEFVLTVTDNGGATASDTVKVTVNPIPPPPNQAPTANAGPDQSITLPINNVNISGSGYDADGTITGYQWQKIAGPAAYNIAAPGQAQTSITGMVQGVYQFTLTVTDNQGATGSDTITITVNHAANQPPTANAGADQTITLPINSITLNGSGTDADGTITSYQWSKINGPAQFVIASPTQAQTAVTGLVQGSYQFMLTVTDNQGATGNDTITITVNQAANQPPTANAGTDQTITLPTNNVTLNGSGYDADGTITGYQWTKISGPAQFVIASPTQAQTAVTGLVQGAYQFMLTVTDNQGATATAVVTITVNQAANQPPTANAGADQTITLPTNNVTLNGSGTDADGTIASYQWTKISGPATYNIAALSQAQTSITGLVQGVYQFKLTVTDNQGATGSDTITITVNLAANQPPTANAGADQTITLPTNNVTLNGSGTDADGTIASYQWTKINGPATYNIAAPSQAQTSITGLVQGIYQFRLTVTDNLGASGSDTITITVNHAANQPPTANAGTDQTITLPTNNVTLNGSGTDADGTIASYQWSKINGPAQFVIASPTQAQTAVTGLVQGAYQFMLTVTDNQGATGNDTILITVNNPNNQTPVANAGVDLEVTLPTNSVTLNGSGTDADGTIVGYQWKKLTGPVSITIANAQQAQTVVSNLEAGVYVFELMVTDNLGATATATMRVTVNAATNIPPTSRAGRDTTIRLPINTVQLLGSGDDIDGTIASYHWSKIDGPVQYSIQNPDQASTMITNLVLGTYLFELRVTDDRGAVGRDTVKIIVLEDNRRISTATVFPNPARDIINIRIDAITNTNAKGELMILNAAGVRVFGKEINRTQQQMVEQVDISKLTPGTYIIKVGVDINTTATITFIKQ